MSHRLPSGKAPQPGTQNLNIIKMLLVLFDDAESLKKATYNNTHEVTIK
jgi:hypothetical protein